MSDTSLFDGAAERLHGSTDLSQLAARGVLRLALKEAGLEPKDLDGSKFAAIARHLLPAVLKKNGVKDVDAVINAMTEHVSKLEQSPRGTEKQTSVESVFARLGGG